MTRIRFNKYGACTAIGNFEPGTIARVSEAMAKHLVDEIRVAEYVEAPVPAPEPQPSKPRRRK